MIRKGMTCYILENMASIQICECGFRNTLVKRKDDNRLTVDSVEAITQYRDAKKSGKLDTLDYNNFSWLGIQQASNFTSMKRNDRKDLLSRIPKDVPFSLKCVSCGIENPMKPGTRWDDFTTYGTVEEEDYSRHRFNKTLPVVKNTCQHCNNNTALLLREDAKESYGGVVMVLICTKCGEHKHATPENI